MTERLLLDELTTSMAESVAVDEALAAQVGEWSIDEPVAADRMAFATVSRWFGQHAEALRSLLPDSPALAASERVVVPGEWVERINRLAPAPDRVAALLAVVADRCERNARALERLDSVADRELMRHLAHTRLDLEAIEGLLAAR